LVNWIRREHIWSMKSSYSAAISDSGGTNLRLRSDLRRMKSPTNVGTMAGMPREIQRLEDEIDRVARVEEWKRCRRRHRYHAAPRGFDFHSPQAGFSVARALANESPPHRGALERCRPRRSARSARRRFLGQEFGFESVTALENGQSSSLMPWSHGARWTSTASVPQARIDAAFQAPSAAAALKRSSRSGANAAQPSRPRLFTTSPCPRTISRAEPAKTAVTLLLMPTKENTPPVDAHRDREVAASQGVDLKARSAEAAPCCMSP
jgi:hypothetical protein